VACERGEDRLGPGACRSIAATDTCSFDSPSDYEYGPRLVEINLGCNYECEHCYLGLKQFSGLDWDARARLLHMLRDAGVLVAAIDRRGAAHRQSCSSRRTPWRTSSA